MSRNQDDDATRAEKLDEAADKVHEAAQILDEVRGEVDPSEVPGEGGVDPSEGPQSQLPGNGSKVSPI